MNNLEDSVGQTPNTISFFALPFREVMRISPNGIWVDSSLPVDEVARRVFELLEPMIVKSYANRATQLTEGTEDE
jgi:hypothetical protein